MTEKTKVRTCTRCGCTEARACVDDDGCPCYWVKPEICSVCATQSDMDDYLKWIRNGCQQGEKTQVYGGNNATRNQD